jgi:hypothetical protein
MTKIYEIITIDGGDNMVKDMDTLTQIAQDLKSPIFMQRLSNEMEYTVFHAGVRFVWNEKISNEMYDW